MSTPLRDLLTTILFDPPTRAEFAADPEGFLGGHGWEELDGTDVQAALGALADELPIDRATLLAPALDHEAATGPAGAVDGLQLAITAVGDGSPAQPYADAEVDAAPDPGADADPSDGIDGDAGEVATVALGEDSDLDLEVDIDDAVELDAPEEAAGIPWESDAMDESADEFGVGSGQAAGAGDEDSGGGVATVEEPDGALDQHASPADIVAVDPEDDPFGESADALAVSPDGEAPAADHDQPGEPGEPGEPGLG